MEPSSNLHRGVEKIEDVGESVATYLRGLFAEFRSTTSDAVLHQKLDREIASIDTSVKVILANTKAEPKPEPEPSKEDKEEADKKAEQDKKDVAGKPIPVNAIEDIPPESDPKSEEFTLRTISDEDEAPEPTKPQAFQNGDQSGYASSQSFAQQQTASLGEPYANQQAPSSEHVAQEHEEPVAPTAPEEHDEPVGLPPPDEPKGLSATPEPTEPEEAPSKFAAFSQHVDHDLPEPEHHADHDEP